MKQALDQLKVKAESGSHFKECCLPLDSLSIVCDSVWDKRQGQFVGFPVGSVPLGNDFANQALVCMAVELRRQWEIVIGYMFGKNTDSNLLSGLCLHNENICGRSLRCGT